MSSRKFNKQIEVYEFGTPVSDGFGGFTATDTLSGTSWAMIRTFQTGKYRNSEDFGVINPELSIEVTVRYNPDLDYNPDKYYIKYDGVSYNIASKPTDIDFKHKEVVFIASKND